MNKDWPLWIRKSVYKHFKDTCHTYPMYVEGQGRKNVEKNVEFFEIRIDGPVISEISRKYFFIEASISALIQVKVDQNDLYKSDKVTSDILKGFTTIQIRNDANEVIGCFQPMTEDGLFIHSLGEIAQSWDVIQVGILCEYKMSLSED